MAILGSRLIYIALGSVLLLSLFASAALPQGYNVSNEINSTLAYVDKVNQSAYLIFYPDLAPAYGYIDNAINVSQTNPSYAEMLLSEARSSAGQQLDLIDRYRSVSFYALAIISLLLVFLLYRFMKYGKGRRRLSHVRQMSKSSRLVG